MRYFSKLGINGKVIEINVVHSNELKDSNGVEHESLGIEFLTNLTGYPNWKQHWRDGSKRKNPSGIGYTYDEDRDAFIPPKTYASWILNESTCRWEPPVVRPDDGKFYNWDEPTVNWKLKV